MKERRFSRRTFCSGLLGMGSLAVIKQTPLRFFEPLWSPSAVEAQEPLADFTLLNGHFYTQTRGEKPYPYGYTVIDDKEAPLWDIFQKYGGVEKWGYPVSNKYKDELGRVCQVFQKGIFQISVDGQGKMTNIEWMNILDELEKRKVNLAKYLIPPSLDWQSDRVLSWEHSRFGDKPGTKEANHISIVFGQAPEYPQLKDYFLANPYWLEQYGLPMSVQKYDGVVVVRCQRTVFQLWQDKTFWTTKPKEIVAANSGDLAKEYGLIPLQAQEPIQPSGESQTIEKYQTGLIVRRGDPTKPYVYLTIDDFWEPKSLDLILDIAKANKIKLTLFPVGSVMGNYPAGFRRAVAEGHRIENHTQTHPWLSSLSEKEIRWEIRQQRETVREILGDPGYQQKFLRPPGGAGILGFVNQRLVQIAQEEGLKIAMWTADSNGFRVYPRTDEEAQNYVMGSIRAGLGNGSIVLQHAIAPDMAILENLIREVKQRGLVPITLDEGIA
ncbi:MAG: polysaccharide deacetylase family protein [bacterium]|nr:polysaccharide deacetylase family protein [bacterium]